MALTQVDQGLLGTYAQYTGFKNKLINGAMAIAQRGTTSASTGYQTVDRWQVNNCTNQAQVTDAPTGFSNSLEITGTVAGSSGYGLVNQYIESKNVISLLGNSCTLSAWVKNTGTSTANVSCEVYYANTTDNFSAVTLISSLTSQAITTGWTRITFPAVSIPTAASTGIAIRLFRYDGSNSQKWEITGVQFELGSTATSFDYRPYGTELQLCQRYYWQVGSNSSSETQIAIFTAQSATLAYADVYAPVQMRASPTGSSTGNFQWTQNGGQTTVTPSVPITSPWSSMLQITVSSLTTGTCGRLSIAASASGVFSLSAEL